MADVKRKTMHVNSALCAGCGLCLNSCPKNAISIHLNKARIDDSRCIGCQNCVNVCPLNAITPNDSDDSSGTWKVKDLRNRIERIREKISQLSRSVEKLKTR